MIIVLINCTHHIEIHREIEKYNIKRKYLNIFYVVGEMYFICYSYNSIINFSMIQSKGASKNMYIKY